ncbi:shikimate dehydrogenase [Dinoroseobacter sp. S124A]|uniref:shikimate dehydrogenase n=1 Tax=Dinoroseobacter sp. S124A TaxID=3415128 RepID=UPI003C79BDB1
MTDHKVPIAGVIGNPIAHSRSPHLHGHWLRTYGIDGYYVPLHVQGQDLAEVFRALPKLGFKGVNVTLPHKERALELADRVSDRAALIGAANTITFQPDGTIHADNTDGYGFIENLRAGAPGWSPRTGPIVVLGAGGAARGVLSALLEAGAPEIRLANRTRVKAESLRHDFGPRVTVVDWHRVSDVLEDATTLVNTTSLGMEGQAELSISIDALPRDAVVTDIVYRPLITKLLGTAMSRGNPIVDGLGMLLHQAAPGFERWFGLRPEITPELRAAALAE